MSPATGVRPRVFINGVEAVELGQGLVSLEVHVRDGRATAVVECAGALSTASGMTVGADADEMVVRLRDGDDTCFSGRLTEVELRVMPQDAPRVVLSAAGPATSAVDRPPVALVLGADVESGSVRRAASGSVAHLVTGRWDLGVGRLVDLTTGHGAFDGRFRIVEHRCCLDPSSGLRVDLVAALVTA